YVLFMTRRLLKIVFPNKPLISDFGPLIVAVQMSFVLSMIDAMETAAATVLLITALTRFAEECLPTPTPSLKGRESNAESPVGHVRSALFFAMAALCRPELTIVFP